MKKIIIISLILCSVCSVYSQKQKDCLDRLEEKIHVIDSLQNKVIKPLENDMLELRGKIKVLGKDTIELRGKIKVLGNDTIALNKKIKDLEKDIAKLDKNKVKIEKDTLQKQVEGLTAQITSLSQKLSNQNKQISDEKQNHVQELLKEKEEGKKEALANLLNSYKIKNFDEIINVSCKQFVQRDIQLVGDTAELKTILSDLEKYFNARELLAQKFDVAQIEKAQIELKQVNRQSDLLDELKENLVYYKNFNDGLKETMEQLVDLDKRIVAGEDTAIQELKSRKILSELNNYMNKNYYDYGNYPYLSNIVLEIIKRKTNNVDTDITDLLERL